MLKMAYGFNKNTIMVVQERDAEGRGALLTTSGHRKPHMFGVSKHWWEFIHFPQYLCHPCQKPQRMRVKKKNHKILDLSSFKPEVTN